MYKLCVYLDNKIVNYYDVVCKDGKFYYKFDENKHMATLKLKI